MAIQLEQPDLRQLGSILARRRWVIGVVMLAAVLVALIASYTATPLYRSTATLQIVRQNPDILTYRDLARVDYSWAAYDDYYETQYKIIAGATVAKAAAEQVDLGNRPEFVPGEVEPSLLSGLKSLLPARGEPVEVDAEDRLAAVVRGGLEVTPVRNSQLVRIGWVSEDPSLAQSVAQAVADSYIRSTLRTKFDVSEQAKLFLIDQIETLRNEIRESEQELQGIGEEQGIVSIDQSENTTMKALQDIAGERTLAKTALARAEARYKAVASTPSAGLPEVMNSALITQLRHEFAEYEAGYTEKAKTFKEDWPELQSLRSRLDQAGRRLELETERIADQVRASAKSQYESALNAVENLDRLLDSQQGAAQKLKRDSIDYAHELSVVQKMREALDTLLQRRNEMAVSARLGDAGEDSNNLSSNIRVVEKAALPTAPFRPDIKLNLTLGFVLGLSLGVGLAFLIDYLDNTINTADELRRLVDIPSLAVIPAYGPRASSGIRGRRGQSAGGAGSIDLVAHHDARAAASEAYRELRTSLLLSHAGEPPRMIMVSSAIPGEGKTATAVNLAVVLAQLGRRVLLVDTDLRRPRLNKVFKVSGQDGLSTYLSGMEEHAGTLIRATEVDNLDLLPSGPIPPNPSELLNSEVFSGIGKEFARLGYDHVVFDSPPVLAVPDPLIIAQSADVGIVVARAGSTAKALVRSAAEKLAQASPISFGIVLNGVDPDGPGEYKYRYQSVYRHEEEPRADEGARRASGGG